VRRVSLLVVAVALTVALAACGSDAPTATATGLDKRTVEAGAVKVTIAPARVDGAGASFGIAFDTHTEDLALDVAASAALTVGGTPWTGATWAGAGPGGHHREGTLTFTAAGAPKGEVILTIEGLDQPVRASWEVPTAG
jgi:hypothetical protein